MVPRLIAATLAVVVLAPNDPIHAQDWPTRTVTMVVPFPAGGPLDVAARILAQPMGDLLGQQVDQCAEIKPCNKIVNQPRKINQHCEQKNTVH